MSRVALPAVFFAAFVVAVAMLPVVGPPQNDFAMFLLPWMEQIHERGFASIAGDFSAYAPPYIYLLNIAALWEPFVGTVAAIKLVSLPFVVGTAFGIGAIVSTLKPSLGKTATAVAIVTPSLLVNAFAWGQADAVFTCFLVWFVAFAMRGQMVAAAILFGLALSFKVQAVFVGPLVLYLALSGQMRARDLALIPLTYAAMMLPAALAGRPWSELLTLYYSQAHYMSGLSFNTPSPWVYAELFIPYRTGMAIGLGLGALASLGISFGALRLECSPYTVLVIACLSAAVMPYVLPNMTARYFFVADMLTIALAFVRPRLWPVAVLIQFGSLISYLAYFAGIATAHLGFFPMTLGIALLAWECRRRWRKAAVRCVTGDALGNPNLV